MSVRKLLLDMILSFKLAILIFTGRPIWMDSLFYYNMIMLTLQHGVFNFKLVENSRIARVY